MTVNGTGASEGAMNSTTAREYDALVEYAKSEGAKLQAAGTGMVDGNSTFAQALSRVQSSTLDMVQDYGAMASTGMNTFGLDAGSYDTLLKGSSFMRTFLGDAPRGELNVDNAMSILQQMDERLPGDMPPPPPPGTAGGTGAGTGVSGGTIGGLDSVRDVLTTAEGAGDVGSKSDAIGTAIDMLINKLKGGDAGAAPGGSTGGSAVADRIGEITDIIGGGGAPAPGPSGDDWIGIPGGPDGVEMRPPVILPTQPVDRRVEGSDLMQYLDAGGKEIGVNRDGSLGVRGGLLNNEIDTNESMTFTPPGGVADGATVDLAHLWNGGPNKIQERGWVEVTRPDGTVEKIEFGGTKDGKLSVEIEGEFTKLEFKAEDTGSRKSKRNSEFAVAAITFGEKAPATGDGGTGPVVGGPAPAPEPAPAPAPAPAPTVEMRPVEGDELLQNLDAGGKEISINRDGSMGIKGGSQSDEIDGRESLVFTPPGGTANGAEIEVSKLFNGGPDKIQERGWVEVTRPDGTVEKIEFGGTKSGTAKIEIEGEFTKLEFKAEDTGSGKSKRNSEFALKSISIGETVEPAPTPGPAPGPAPTPGGEGIPPEALAGLLEGLDAVRTAIEFSDLPPEEKEKALDAVAEVVGKVVEAMDPGSEGGSSVSTSELVGILGELKDTIAPTEQAGDAGNAALDAIAEGLGDIVTALGGGATAEV